MATFESELKKVNLLIEKTEGLECDYIGDPRFYLDIKKHIEQTSCGLATVSGTVLNISWYCDGY
jgi:hypothetical protein